MMADGWPCIATPQLGSLPVVLKWRQRRLLLCIGILAMQLDPTFTSAVTNCDQLDCSMGGKLGKAGS